ncbi:hypothetical protein B0H11DRAFT_1938252 [Mycena galericulata]|nr:hypothetical protein B0H11DRAFT_1938252 [Mycena galericulata]
MNVPERGDQDATHQRGATLHTDSRQDFRSRVAPATSGERPPPVPLARPMRGTTRWTSPSVTLAGLPILHTIALAPGTRVSATMIQAVPSKCGAAAATLDAGHNNIVLAHFTRSATKYSAAPTERPNYSARMPHSLLRTANCPRQRVVDCACARTRCMEEKSGSEPQPVKEHRHKKSNTDEGPDNTSAASNLQSGQCDGLRQSAGLKYIEKRGTEVLKGRKWQGRAKENGVAKKDVVVMPKLGHNGCQGTAPESLKFRSRQEQTIPNSATCRVGTSIPATPTPAPHANGGTHLGSHQIARSPPLFPRFPRAHDSALALLGPTRFASNLDGPPFGFPSTGAPSLSQPEAGPLASPTFRLAKRRYYLARCSLATTRPARSRAPRGPLEQPFRRGVSYPSHLARRLAPRYPPGRRRPSTLPTPPQALRWMLNTLLPLVVPIPPWLPTAASLVTSMSLSMQQRAIYSAVRFSTLLPVHDDDSHILGNEKRKLDETEDDRPRKRAGKEVETGSQGAQE